MLSLISDEVIDKDYFSKDFKVSSMGTGIAVTQDTMGTGMVTQDSCCLHSCFFSF